MLWKVKDKNQRAKIIEEAGLDVSEEQFFGMLDHCICEPYGFLCIDFQPKTQMTQFRKCFKTFLNPADFHKDVSTNSKVYFSAQLADNSSSTAATTTHPNMGWLQSRTVDSTGNIGTSGTATQWNDFVANGYLVPRTGVYQIAAYQSIKANDKNCGFTGLVMKVGGSVYAKTRDAPREFRA